MAIEKPSGDFGATLRAARERRGVTLRQIANATKISFGQLESLEKNDISKLPGGIFSRAFVRSYAVEVGLDPEATIQEFIAQFPHESVTIGHPASKQAEDHDALESDRRTAFTLLGLLAISVPIAAGVLYFTIAGRRVAPAVAAVSVLATPAGRAEPAAPDPLQASPRTVLTSSAEPSGQAPSAVPAAVAAAAPVPGAPVTGEVLLVGLSVRRPCWVSASVDGRKTIERLLQAGEQRTLEVHRELAITAGDASALALTFNGADTQPLGKAGEVVTARFDLTNFRNYLQVR